MIYVGMDVSFKGFMIHAITEKKKVVFKGEIPASPRGLQALLKSLPDQRKLFAFEAGNQMKWIALFLKEQRQVNIYVVHPNEVMYRSGFLGQVTGFNHAAACAASRSRLT